MKRLIGSLFKLVFLFVVILGIVFGVAYKFRTKTVPLENFVRQNIMPLIMEDTTGMGAGLDTVLSPQEEMALQITQRNNALDVRNLSLDSLQTAVELRRDSLDLARQALIDLQTSLTQQEDANLDQLAKFYENMKAPAASEILLQLDDQTVVEILSKMKAMQAAKIIEVIDPVRAADIIKRYKRMKKSDQ
ncbi:MAG: hypothetical protein GY863_24525 [bacterium]|nr:hypothetical protein [bacterium]